MNGRSFLRALSFGLHGVREAFQRERNMNRHFWLFQILVVIELLLRPELPIVVVSLFVAMCVFAAELFNTAIEHAVDLVVGMQRHPLARAAKDAASGAVTMISFGSLLIGTWILISTWPWHVQLFSGQQIWTPILLLVSDAVTWMVRLTPVSEVTMDMQEGENDDI